MDEILRMRGIRKSYYIGDDELEVLHGVDLVVKKGDFIAILGPSGSGKTTLMNIIGCLDVPSAGTYHLSGSDIEEMDEAELAAARNREIGFVFQNFQLLPRMNALQNVELPLIYAGTGARERRHLAAEMLGRMGLSDKLRNLPTQLSGGQQQRVAIARALVTEPTILLADEPTGALDQKTGAQLMELFCELNRDGRTIIMITHDRDVATNARRVVNILDGRLSEEEASEG